MVPEHRGRLAHALAGGIGDEPGHGGMAFPAARAWKRGVRHLADQHVLEGVLPIALELAGGLPPDEVSRLQEV
jgi:hypothetical protein